MQDTVGHLFQEAVDEHESRSTVRRGNAQVIGLEHVKTLYPSESTARSALRELSPKLKKGKQYDSLVNSLQKRINAALQTESSAQAALINNNGIGCPETIEFYKHHFNYVDRIDLMLSYLKSPVSIHPSLVWLNYILRLAVVQIYSTICHNQWDFQGFDFEEFSGMNATERSAFYINKHLCVRRSGKTPCVKADSSRGLIDRLILTDGQ